MTAVRFLHDQGGPFMMTGQRWNTDFPGRIDFSEPDWAGLARNRAARLGRLQPHAAMDYFVYSRGVIRDHPPMLVGRGYNDNWMVFRPLASGAEVVDATPSVVDIHQNHDYSHIGSEQARWRSQESLEEKARSGRRTGPFPESRLAQAGLFSARTHLESSKKRPEAQAMTG